MDPYLPLAPPVRRLSNSSDSPGDVGLSVFHADHPP